MPFGPPPATTSPLASPFGDFGTCTSHTTPARYARALARGLARWYAAGEGARSAERAGWVVRPEGRRAPHATIDIDYRCAT